MTKSVFISRDLTSESPFYRLLTRAGFEVTGHSLLDFKPVAFSMPPPVDWVFCYSARSVEFFSQGLSDLGFALSRYPRYAAMGKGTAGAFEKIGRKPDFVGSGQPDRTAAAFLEVAKGKRVLFPRARQSRQSVQRLLKNDVEALDLVVYENQVRQRVMIPVTDYVVLTSPLNVQAFFADGRARENLRLVAIGFTTGEALSDQQVESFKIASNATETALAQTILDWETQ